MDYIKAQQDILAAILSEYPRPVYYRKTVGCLTHFFHPSGAYGYAIPDDQLVLSLDKCLPMERNPCKFCLIEDAREITTTGVMLEHNKRTLVEFKGKDGVLSYFDKKLLAKFGKDARLYQDSPIHAATVTDGTQLLIGYLCPVNYMKYTN